LKSITDIIKERVCIDCNHYCASIDILKNHRKIIHKRIVNTKKKPRKVICRREKEVLVQLQEDLDWVEAENLDIEEERANTDIIVEYQNVFAVEDHFQPIWEND
jgi:predicted dinucleotide-utilizing enzyme